MPTQTKRLLQQLKKGLVETYGQRPNAVYLYDASDTI